jgi:D-galactarolactone cycloisomerase
MKIREIRAFGLRGRTPEGGWSNELQPEDCVHTIVAVLTDDGRTGWGSVFTSEALVKAALAVLRPLYEGENAAEPERVSEKLHQNTFWQGRGGSITHAISGIDMALWDLLGKVSGQPVGRLLGGRYRERVRPYASLLMREPEQMAGELLPVKAQGFRAFKIGWGPFGRALDLKLDEAIVGAAREAAGAEAQLFVDAGASDAHWPHGLKWAMRTAEMLKDYDIGWFEEALKPDAIDDFCNLRRVSPVPIAGGEVLTRRQSFLPWLSRGAFDIVQPDVTKVGGISEQRRIAWIAHDFGVKYIGHGWNTALGVAADLQLAAALPGVDLVEFIGGSTYVDGITETPFKLDAEGNLAIPMVPGLGVKLDREKLKRVTRDPSVLFES